MHSVDAKAKIAKIEDQQENAISARKKMFDLSFNKQHICDNLMKGISYPPEKKLPVKKESIMTPMPSKPPAINTPASSTHKPPGTARND